MSKRDSSAPYVARHISLNAGCSGVETPPFGSWEAFIDWIQLYQSQTTISRAPALGIASTSTPLSSRFPTFTRCPLDTLPIHFSRSTLFTRKATLRGCLTPTPVSRSLFIPPNSLRSLAPHPRVSCKADCQISTGC